LLIIVKKKISPKGRGGYSDRIVNRILAQLKTLAKWIHKLTGNVTVFQKQPGHTDSAYSR
jgi:hypothetical protein